MTPEEWKKFQSLITPQHRVLEEFEGFSEEGLLKSNVSDNPDDFAAMLNVWFPSRGPSRDPDAVFPLPARWLQYWIWGGWYSIDDILMDEEEAQES